ncbi:structural maintenance of chromosomes protein 1A isoform X2 [Cimex lectularius]|uniref:Structural maintenance of chromosomes protein n=1 Tax=Cimex lectularius TaxID=79782 RepID=A0A8I6RDH6_CIMLE|nr:structural maintenance of chromosomes protein 1A isoform X2 [Cimex lectularius]
MPAFLQSIEVENFKSYRGKFTIGPLKSFTAVVGPNGSGKSNFMDAISFVMGEKTSALRVKRLSDLIHGASIGQPISKVASVTAVFLLEDGNLKRFTRTVQGSSSDYRIDREAVTTQKYLGDLEHLGINVKAKNFLVFQGAVESIAMKNPKELTSLFEEISGSGVLKEEYDRLKQEVLKAEEETNFSYLKKRGVVAERKEAKLEKDEAEKYQRLKDELVEKEIEYQLFRLYNNENDIQYYETELEKKRKEVEKIEKKKEAAEEALKDKKKEQGKANRELAKIDQDIREVEAEISKKRPSFIKSKERTAHLQKKLNTAKKSLAEVKQAAEAHSEDTRLLEEELAEVNRKREEYEANEKDASQSQGRDIHLEETQVQEYHSLKVEAQKRSAQYLQDLDSINREQKAEQDQLDNEIRLRTQMESQIRQKGHERDEAQKRVDKLTDHIRASEQSLEEQKKLQIDLQSDVGTSKDRVKELQTELESIMEQLGDARVDKHEDSRRKKKQEIVENFKRNFPTGVYDRMINMCHPQHKKYNVAVTKVLGKYMEAIVVDTEKTARQCIQYLKENLLDPETFLPLDYIQTKPLKERLRAIKDPKNTRLLYDILNFHPPDIKQAVLFATNNALVCDTPEDAMRAAYEIDGANRYDAVALDGTFYQKSGIMSGGSLDLARKAKRWDEKHMSQLKSMKEKLSDDLRDAMKKSRKESELNTVESQIRGLETRIRYAKTDKEKTLKQIEGLEQELRVMEARYEETGPRREKIEKSMAERDIRIQEMKERMNSVEDVVFKDFCRKIGMENIRQYEERELRSQQERMKKRMEFENQKNRIVNQLEFEKSKDKKIKDNVTRWENSVRDAEEELDIAKKAEQKQQGELEKEMKQIEELKSKRLLHKQEVDKMDEAIGKARREVGSIAKDIQTAQKSVTNIESKLEMKKAERHSILMHCKMEDIQIPMTHGNMEDIGQETTGGESMDTSTTSSQSMNDRESRIVIDYSGLSENLKDIDEDDIKKVGDKLAKVISDQSMMLQKIQAPNMKAIEKLELARGKLQVTNEEFENARKRAKKAKQNFERIKKERYDKFVECFEHLSNVIDNIYKSLAKNPSAQAYLSSENPEEPYLDGISYNCVAPGKRFQPMCNLSGGEKTIAALALLFAIHSYQPAPFFVLDEIDAALDNTNIGKVASYIHSETSNLQTIVISLKEEFFSHAEALIGICPDAGECLISRVITLDLSEYQQHW